MNKCLERCANAYGVDEDGFVRCGLLPGDTWINPATVGDCDLYTLNTRTPEVERVYSIKELRKMANDKSTDYGYNPTIVRNKMRKAK